MRFALSALVVSLSVTAAHAQECAPLGRGIRISATGDILVHKALFQEAVGSSQRFKLLWDDKVEAVIKNADFAVGNLEGPVAPNTTVNGKTTQNVGFVYDDFVYSGTNFVFNYHPYLIQDLLDTGFDLVTTANNHSLDRGSVGVDRTIEQLDAAGMPYVGTRVKGSDAARERIVNVRGYRVGMISCTEMTNDMLDPNKQVLLCGSEQVTKSVANLKAQADAVIVFPHWGEEYQLNPNKHQKNKAREWVKAGATAIVGNHPHVVQTTEWIERPDGSQALVIYSLGNFVAAQRAMESRVTAIAHIDLMEVGGSLQIAQYSYTPVIRPSGSVTIKLLSSTSDEGKYLKRQLGASVCQ